MFLNLQLISFKAKIETKQFLQTTVTKYYSSSDRADAVTLMWNHLMGEMSCCGVTNYEDFNLSENWVQNKGNRTIPEACCVLTTDKKLFTPRDSNCPQSPTEKNSYFMKVCSNAIKVLMGFQKIAYHFRDVTTLFWITSPCTEILLLASQLVSFVSSCLPFSWLSVYVSQLTNIDETVDCK